MHDIYYDNPLSIALMKEDPLQPLTKSQKAVGALSVLFSLGTQPVDSLAQRVTFPSETIGQCRRCITLQQRTHTQLMT